MAGGGIGEAMLIGAAVGGGSAALQGQDPLRGALLGAATGGVGSGIASGVSSALSSGAAGAGAAGAGAGAAGTAAAAETALAESALANAGVTPGAFGATPAFGASPATLGSGMYNIPVSGITPPVPATLGSSSGMLGSGTYGMNISPAAAPSAAASASGGMPSLSDIWSGMSPTKQAIVGAGGIASLGGMLNQPKGAGAPEDEEDYSKYFAKFDREKFNPSRAYFAEGGGISSLGGYSDGGRMLKGPGDGMSDSIPASIDGRRPARLADGEFVVPADVVSHLGNGSTDAGSKQLYAMMDKVRKARTGNKKQGRQINPSKYVPA